MKTDAYGRIYLTTDDLCAILYKNPTENIEKYAVDDPDQYNCNIDKFYLDIPHLKKYTQDASISIEDFDRQNIENWHMPDEYKNLDIVEHIISLCKTQQELDRVATELLLYQERNLFDLLRFLKYMIDVFNKNNIVHGVGRGSSTSSYVLYLLGVHFIDSIKYDLDINEFLK